MTARFSLPRFVGALGIALALAAETRAQHDGHARHPRDAARSCAPGTLACASSATPAFRPDGTLLVAFTSGGVVSVARSADLGKTFSRPVQLAPPVPRMDTGADARPQIVVDARGRTVVAYAVFKDERWNAEVLVSRSEDGGATFTRPKTIGENPASQRFPILALDRAGNVFAAWLDKRNSGPTKAAREALPASLAYAWSVDGGRTFSPGRIARDGTCECCRIGIAMSDGARPVMVLRNVYPGAVRDHAVVAFRDRDTPGIVERVADDRWVTNTCPHHGPALAIGADGAVHVAWFTEGERREGLFYARSRATGEPFSAPMAIGRADRLPARPSLVALGDDLLLAWKEFDGERTSVLAMRSGDGGAHWSEPRTLATTTGFSDHPLLAAHGGRAWLSWLSHPEGYRLLPVEVR